MTRTTNSTQHSPRPTTPDWPRHRHKGRVSVYVGDVVTSARPVVLDTLLGSCVAVCLFDPYLAMGGMNHILLPGTRLDTRCTRFGVHAMELLINDLMKRGCDKRSMVAKAFGGASVLAGLKIGNIGEDNAVFVREFLAAERIPLVAHRLGGTDPVHLYFKTDTGKARLHTVDGSQLTRIIHAEDSFYKKSQIEDQFVSGDITLF